MGVRRKSLQGLAAHTLGGRIRCDLLGVGSFQLLQLPVEHVVFIVAHGGGIQYVVPVAVFIENVAQFLDALAVVHGNLPLSVVEYIVLQVFLVGLR